jgi:hypothetical protein
MSDFDVHFDEMSSIRPLDDAALEAYLTGRPGAADELEPLTLFAEGLEMALAGPAPAPKPNLATLLIEGFSTEKGDLPATAASNVTGPASQAAGLPKWRKKKMLVTEFLSGLAAKLAGLGLAAKLGLGVGVAAAAVGGAGAANVLPEPVQHAVATAVDTVTPFQFPDKADPHSVFGATVAADATGASDGTPGVDGQTVADAAKQQGAANQGTGADRANNSGATGSTGLDRANETPAAGHVPTSLPTPPANPGTQSSTGLDRANQTPAAGHVPTSLPTPTSVPPQASSPGSQGSTGLDQAGQTPAAGHAPTNAGRP